MSVHFNHDWYFFNNFKNTLEFPLYSLRYILICAIKLERKKKKKQR